MGEIEVDAVIELEMSTWNSSTGLSSRIYLIRRMRVNRSSRRRRRRRRWFGFLSFFHSSLFGDMTSTTADIVGPLSTKFFTKTWLPTGPPKAALLFIHG